MGTRYIEINSAYRNRDEYPNMGEFIVPFSVDSNTVFSQSYISDAFPVYVFQPGSLNYPTMSSIPPLTNYFITSSLNSPACNVNVNETGAYIGYYLALNNTTLGVNQNNRLITSFDPSTSTFTIVPPFTLVGTTNPIVPFNQAVSNYTVSDPSPLYDTIRNQFSINVQYRDIYNRIPTAGSNVLPNYIVMSEETYPVLPLPATLSYDFGTIQTYDASIQSLYTDKNLSFSFTNPNVSIRKSLPLQKGYTLYATSRNTVVITPVPGMKASDYKDLLIYIIPFKSQDPTQITGDENIFPDVSINRMTWDEYVYPIKSFDPLTNTATLTKKINQELYSAPWGVSVNPNGRRAYEILGNIKSSVYPLAYSGSLVSQAETVCYEVELLDLILPNVPLIDGSRIIKYPYVYVVLKTDGTDFRVGRNIITSNNPNSYEATFVCGVTNIVDPAQARFVKIDAMGMTQTIKFKPNATLYFKVYLPDGTLFQPLEEDYPSPLPANPLLQIEATFGIRRV